MGSRCSCLTTPSSSETRPLQQILAFPELEIPPFPSDDFLERTWDYVETSSSLLSAIPSFPRLFVHSNKAIDVILPKALQTLSARVKAHPMTYRRFSQDIVFASRKVASRNSRMNDGRYCHIPEYHSDVYFDGSNWVVWQDITPVRQNARGIAPLRRTWKMERESFGDVSFFRGVLWDRIGRTSRKALAVLEEEDICSAPETVFEATVASIRTGKVVIDDSGRAIITDTEVRNELGLYMVDRVQRLLTHGWSQMFHYQVRLCIITTHECTIVLYLNKDRIEVSDLLRRGQGTLSRPCRSLYPLIIAVKASDEKTFRLPPEYLMKPKVRDPLFLVNDLWKCQPQPSQPGSVEHHWWKRPYRPYEGDKKPDYDLSFTYTPLCQPHLSHPTVSTRFTQLGEQASLDELGAPSLHLTPSPQYDFKRIKEYDVSHSLLKVRKWPDLLHGPVDLRRLQVKGLPELIEGPTVTPTVLKQPPVVDRDVKRPDLIFRPQSLLLDDSIAFGALWDVFRVTIPINPGLSQPPFPLVGKILAIDCFETTITLPISTAYNPFRRAQISQSQAREHIRKDFETLSRLSEILPPVIPQIMGLWGGIQRGKEAWVVIMEDGGERVDENYPPDRLEEWDVADKNAIIALYARLHDNGILHGDVQKRHWRRRREDKSDPSAIRLIDFDRAIFKSTVSEEKWVKYKRRELGALKRIFSKYNYVSTYPPLPPSVDLEADDDTGTTDAIYPLGYVNGKEPIHLYYRWSGYSSHKSRFRGSDSTSSNTSPSVSVPLHPRS
ncbi:hypothetical protein M231_03494 [Tremella mesenterica]|uniref:Protein kinase domain-containing protein n=1 Tax=Tremella mesenterica TaxID=5217 RepID=A0A4Q1BN44_TREME|nr:hypothetical protein M231_03494 [Tremella mesenterica]